MEQSVGLAEELRRAFRAGGGAGQRTVEVEGLAPDVRAKLVEGAGLRKGEVPVVACWFGAESWVVVTTERVVSRRWGRIQETALGALVLVRMDSVALVDVEGLPARTLVIENMDGLRQVLELEPGPSFDALGALLMLIVRGNARRAGVAFEVEIKPDHHVRRTLFYILVLPILCIGVAVALGGRGWIVWVFEAALVLLLIALWEARRHSWALRALAGLVFLSFLAGAITEPDRRILGGLLTVGLPCAVYCARGKVWLRLS